MASYRDGTCGLARDPLADMLTASVDDGEQNSNFRTPDIASFSG
jgi:hypothetical protein